MSDRTEDIKKLWADYDPDKHGPVCFSTKEECIEAEEFRQENSSSNSKTKKRPNYLRVVCLVAALCAFSSYIYLNNADLEKTYYSAQSQISSVFTEKKSKNRSDAKARKLREIMSAVDLRNDNYSLFNLKTYTIPDGVLVEVKDKYERITIGEQGNYSAKKKKLRTAIGYQDTYKTSRQWDTYNFNTSFKLSNNNDKWVIMVIDAIGDSSIPRIKTYQKNLAHSMKKLFNQTKKNKDIELWFVRADSVPRGSRFWGEGSFARECYKPYSNKKGNGSCMDKLLYAGLYKDDLDTHYLVQHKWLHKALNLREQYHSQLEIELPAVVLVNPKGRAYRLNKRTQLEPYYVLLSVMHQRNLAGLKTKYNLSEAIPEMPIAYKRTFKPSEIEKGIQGLNRAIKEIPSLMSDIAETRRKVLEGQVTSTKTEGPTHYPHEKRFGELFYKDQNGV